MYDYTDNSLRFGRQMAQKSATARAGNWPGTDRHLERVVELTFYAWPMSRVAQKIFRRSLKSQHLLKSPPTAGVYIALFL